ncbi:MAG: hypothetical protein ACLQGP_39045 [Isosphaeraceae bacterium]
MSLELWLQSQYTIKQETTAPELLDLLQVVDRELSDASIPALSSDGKFGHAYNAGLCLCRIALRAAGYRVAKGKGVHQYEINSLVYTLGNEKKDEMIFLSRCSRIRGQEVYDRTGVADPQDVVDLIETVKQLRLDVLSWLKADHPGLYPEGYE